MNKRTNASIKRLQSLDLSRQADKGLVLAKVLIFPDDDQPDEAVILSFVTNNGTCNLTVPMKVARAVGQGIVNVLDYEEYGNGTVVNGHPAKTKVACRKHSIEPDRERRCMIRT